jgi:hypothetical protein
MVRIWSRASVVSRAESSNRRDGGIVFERDSLFRSDMAGDNPREDNLAALQYTTLEIRENELQASQRVVFV